MLNWGKVTVVPSAIHPQTDFPKTGWEHGCDNSFLNRTTCRKGRQLRWAMDLVQRTRTMVSQNAHLSSKKTYQTSYSGPLCAFLYVILENMSTKIGPKVFPTSKNGDFDDASPGPYQLSKARDFRLGAGWSRGLRRLKQATPATRYASLFLWMDRLFFRHDVDCSGTQKTSETIWNHAKSQGFPLKSMINWKNIIWHFGVF